MKRSAIVITTLLTFFLPASAYASVTNSVNISNNGSNSENHVSVTTDTSSNNTNNSNCHTEVHMDSNGEKKDYVSDDCKEVNMDSTNGNNSVKINNTTGTSVADDNPKNDDSDFISNTPTPTVSETPSPTHHPEEKKKIVSHTSGMFGFFEALREKFLNLFKH